MHEFEDIYAKNKHLISNKTHDEICFKFSSGKYRTINQIPELKSKIIDNECDIYEIKLTALTHNQQNDLIRKIPDDTFTRSEIIQIIKHIRTGTMIKEEQMPNPTKKQPKVKLSDIVLDKKVKRV